MSRQTGRRPWSAMRGDSSLAGVGAAEPKPRLLDGVAGDRVRVGTPGGGGYGDPLARNPALVLHDVAMGYYTADQAAEKFGVVVNDDGTAVDLEATNRMRQR